MDTIYVHTDGASRGNPGEAAIGVVIKNDSEELATISEYVGVQTNNWAEYEAVFRALQKIKALGLSEKSIEFRLDSKLVAEQLNGNWKIKSDTIREQYKKVKELLSGGFQEVTFTHVRREFNKEADALANEALDAR